jgi:hypothetical protein
MWPCLKQNLRQGFFSALFRERAGVNLVCTCVHTSVKHRLQHSGDPVPPGVSMTAIAKS